MKQQLLLKFLAVMLLFIVPFMADAQNKKITLTGKSITLKMAFDQIEKQTGMSVDYDAKSINVNAVLEALPQPSSLNEVMQKLLHGTGCTFNVKNSHIIISSTSNQEPEPRKGTSSGMRKIAGVVVDASTGESLPGVNVIIEGSKVGVISDIDGKFFIDIPNSTSELVFSFIGYKQKKVLPHKQGPIRVGLDPDIKKLDEVVVVGYGTQKKANLTGSVSSVSSSELVKRPNNNVANLLQGKITGMQVVQGSGEPGNESASIKIRGMGTFSSAGSDPLVLIDGIEGNLTSLNPADIESISVLKDAASASIYGAKAANGVILVTTKQGEAGKLNIEFSSNFQVQQPTRMPDLVTNSADYMTYWNQANERNNLPDYFSQTEINAYRNGTDPIKYPNFNWIKHMIGNGLEQNHHLSLNGGNDKTKFNVAFGYLDQTGINKAFSFSKANMILNLNTKLNKTVTFGTNNTLNYSKRVEPVMGSSEFMLLCYTAGPEYMPYLSDGSGRWTWRYNNAAWNNRNPEQALSYGNIHHDIYSVKTQSYLDFNLNKNLILEVKGAANFDSEYDKSQEHAVASYFYSDNTLAALSTGYNPGVNVNYTQNILLTLYSTLNYSKTIGNHNLKALLGYSQQSNNYRQLQAFRQIFPSSTLTELNAGSTTNQTLSGTSNNWGLESFFGRINYDYSGKYLLEGNFRYDGSSRLSPNNRWGVFPSLSAGWRLTQENFMKNLTWMDNFKLRASWGKLGNQNIGLYPYQDMLTINSYAFGASASQGASVTALTDKTLKWETTTVKDIGIDFSVSKGLISLTADYFDKLTDNILYQISIPASIGLSSPTVNYGSMKNRGFELEIGHTNQIKDFKYSVNFNISAIKNKVLKVTAPTYGSYTLTQNGLPWKSYYMYQVIGIFQSQDEISKSPTQPYAPKPGDLKYKDVNGDGVINSKDRIVVGGAFPKFYYGGNINLSWKDFDLSTFWQGIAGQKYYTNGFGIEPFIQGTAPTKDFASKAWTSVNHSNTTPAMYTYGYSPVDGLASTYFLRDASYLRLKNLMIGYNVPTAVANKIGMKSLRIYLSGDNLLTFTKYPTGGDPERSGSGNFSTYPQLITYTIGVDIKF